MSGSAGRRRFIAGATCPRCGEVDKVFTQIRSIEIPGQGAGSEQRERGCVSCDFLETISDVDSSDKLTEESKTEAGGTWSPVKLPE